MPHELLEGEVRCMGMFKGDPCKKKFAEFLDGNLILTCSRCKHVNVFDTRKQSSVSSVARVEQLI